MRKIKNVEVSGANIRLAKNTYEEIGRIADLEKKVWGEYAADSHKIKTRLDVFPAGSYIAEDRQTGNIIGYVCFQLTDDLRKISGLSWADITDGGLITNSHRPNGKYLYGIGLSVDAAAARKKLGTAMVSQCFIYMVAHRQAGIFTGSRIPMFAAYKRNYPGVTVEEYVKLKHRGSFYDYELKLYHQSGLAPVNVKVMPDFFPDEDSLNYGVLIFDKNIFRRATAKKIKRVIDIFADNSLQNRKNLLLNEL